MDRRAWTAKSVGTRTTELTVSVGCAPPQALAGAFVYLRYMPIFNTLKADGGLLLA